VVADQLARWPHDREVDQALFLERCLGFGQQRKAFADNLGQIVEDLETLSRPQSAHA